MNLKEYQDAAFKTALPTALNWEYITHNLLAEAHEFAAKVYGGYAKKVRDGKEPDMTALAHELGDVAWHVAIGLDMANIHTGVLRVQQPARTYLRDAFASDLVGLAQAAYNRLDGDEIDCLGVSYLEDMWRLITRSCQPTLGIRFADVLQMNLDKLAARQARGTISGSGDNR